MSFRLPKGSLILVTGATGLIGSATSEELVKRGYKVRAATRDVARTKPFADKLDKLYGSDLFEAVHVKNPAAPDAYEGTLKGVSGILHIAADSSFVTGVDDIVKGAIEATVGLLRSAAKHPEIKAVVLTSSRIAAYNPQYGPSIEVSLSDFTDHLYDYAKELPADDRKYGMVSYAASKVMGERAAWKWVEENKPAYAFNTILPDLVIGTISNPAPGRYSTVSWSQDVFLGDTSGPLLDVVQPATHLVHVQDVAQIHVAALLAEDVDRERLWALSHPFHINDLLQTWRRAYPDNKKLPQDFDFPPNPKQTLDKSRSDELLQRFAGRDWIDMETSILDTVKHVEL